jgi:transcription elongation GreA/GreB family factor
VIRFRLKAPKQRVYGGFYFVLYFYIYMVNKLKQDLYQQCLTYVQNRMDAAQQAIDEAQQAQKDDTKSSAGDKYETGREMAQQETDRNMAQLTEANKLKIILNTINPSVASTQVENGSVVITNNGNFYIAISAGSLAADGLTYFAISLAAPIGVKMRGLKPGDVFNLNGKDYTINSVF